MSAPIPGADAMQAGDPVTGVSVAYTVLKCDAGPILAQQQRPMDANISVSLHCSCRHWP